MKQIQLKFPKKFERVKRLFIFFRLDLMPSALDMLQVGEMSWTGSTEKLQPLKMKLDTSLMTRLRH